MEPLTVNGKQTGFTYIALLISVAILGAVLASLGTIWQVMNQREHEKDLLYIGNQFRNALNHYFQTNNRYPTKLEELVEDQKALNVNRHVRKIFFDPMTGKTDWGTVKLPDKQIVGIYSLSQETPLKTAGFPITYDNFKDKKKYSEWVFLANGQSLVPTPNSPSSGPFGLPGQAPNSPSSGSFGLPAQAPNSPSSGQFGLPAQTANTPSSSFLRPAQ